MNLEPKVSIIIPVREINAFILESLPHYANLNWTNYEILIFPDVLPQEKYTWPKTKIIASGKVGPAEKRDLALQYAKGDFLAFIDDDAFPSPEWLVTALPNFTDMGVVAVGGPGVTPTQASFGEKVSGWVSASPVGAGPYTYRFLPKNRKTVQDYPSMNLIVRRSAFAKVGGFDSHYYPGEDTKLCLDLINNSGEIIYEPAAIVYHHRRPFLIPHLRQNGNYGLHRGFFARILPKTSAKLIYFLPSLLVLNFVTWLFSLFFLPKPLQVLFIWPLLLYLLLLIGNSGWIFSKSRSFSQALVCVPAVFITHLWYGLKFLQGFFLIKKLKR